MLTMIIADDEKIIRESLTDYIDWPSFGIRIVGSCSNGIEAMEAIIDEMPDIVLTDIKMPGIDGLELIERTKEMDLDTEFIVLSGYKEFEFAKKAMKYGVRSYLLKPVNENSLIEAVIEMKEMCNKRIRESNNQMERIELSRQVGEHRKRQMLYEIFSNSRNFMEIVGTYPELRLDQGKKCVVVYFTYLGEEAFVQFAKGLYETLQEENIRCLTDILYVKNTALIVVEEEVAEKLKALEIYANSNKVHYWVLTYTNVEESLSYIVNSLTRYTTIYTIDVNGNTREVYNAVLSLDILSSTIKQLLIAWENEETDEMPKLVDNFLDPMDTISLIRTYGASLISMLLSEISKTYPVKMDISGFFDSIYIERDSKVVKEMIAKQVLLMLTSSKKQESRSTIEKVILHIDNNLSKANLSLKLIAEKHVHMNTDYLGRLFLQETGEKFSHYLNRKRIEKAKQLLLEEDERKIYLVAEKVGCGHNPRYFSQIFKKYTGMTPTEYKKSRE